MIIRRTEEFRNEAVRIALTCGLPRKQAADDLGIGLSTLGKWVASRKYDELLSGPHDDKDKERAHLRAEHERNYCAYGRKRIADELRDSGVVIGERRLMRGNDPIKYQCVAA